MYMIAGVQVLCSHVITLAIKETYMFEIDKYNLDEGCTSQVDMMEETAMQVAELRFTQEQAKLQLDKAQSIADNSVRSKPSDFGLLKVTEAAVKTAVASSALVQEAQQSLLKCKQDLWVADARLQVLDHRKKMLESLIYLHNQGYYSEVRPDNAVVEKGSAAVKRVAK